LRRMVAGGSWLAAAKGAATWGRLGGEREERRVKERIDEKERAVWRFKFRLTAPTCLARLRHATYSITTGCHASNVR
jgi:hypothetical protein